MSNRPWKSWKLMSNRPWKLFGVFGFRFSVFLWIPRCRLAFHKMSWNLSESSKQGWVGKSSTRSVTSLVSICSLFSSLNLELEMNNDIGYTVFFSFPSSLLSDNNRHFFLYLAPSPSFNHEIFFVIWMPFHVSIYHHRYATYACVSLYFVIYWRQQLWHKCRTFVIIYIIQSYSWNISNILLRTYSFLCNTFLWLWFLWSYI